MDRGKSCTHHASELGAWQVKAARKPSYSEGEQHPETSFNILLNFVTVHKNKTPTSMYPLLHSLHCYQPSTSVPSRHLPACRDWYFAFRFRYPARLWPTYCSSLSPFDPIVFHSSKFGYCPTFVNWDRNWATHGSHLT